MSLQQNKRVRMMAEMTMMRTPGGPDEAPEPSFEDPDDGIFRPDKISVGR